MTILGFHHEHVYLLPFLPGSSNYLVIYSRLCMDMKTKDTPLTADNTVAQ